MPPDTPIPTPPLDFWPLAPELILIGVGLILLIVEAAVPRLPHAWLALASAAALIAAGIASYLLWDREGPLTVLGGMVAADRFAIFARFVLLAVTAIGVGLGYQYFRDSPHARGELYPLLLLCTSGMTLIAAASDLIVVFLALEILSLSLYVLTGFSGRLASVEGAMKYFLLGAFSSAFFLYGLALTYGAAGSTNLGTIARELSGRVDPQPLALAGAGLLAVGFAFKVAAVPFHMWAPDAYQGAPAPITAYMAAATKVAAFAAFIRVFFTAFSALTLDWTPFVYALSVVTMVVGSVLAIAQTDFKRMLAYSSVAHAGFILVGFTAANQEGISSSLFYLVAYAAMIVGAFGVAVLISVRGDERSGLASFAGLARRSPGLAAVLTLFLLSLAGLPPAAGFIAKVGVFRAAVDAGHWPLVLVAVLASVVAAFFYLRVVVLMYAQEPEYLPETAGGPLPVATLAVPAIATLALGVFPQWLFDVLDSASVLRW